MSEPSVTLLGDSAVVLEWEQTIDPDAHAGIVAFARDLSLNAAQGFIEAVPAYASLTVHLDPTRLRNEPAELLVDAWRSRAMAPSQEARRTIRIPVHYDGPDLEELSASLGLAQADIVRLHCGRAYRVYLLGFMPGFAYMGEVDPRIAAPRRATPRTRVPAGSVGIAGKQTGVYPLDSPGGWQIIGHTPLRLFDPSASEPSLLRAGDEVIFEAIP